MYTNENLTERLRWVGSATKQYLNPDGPEAADRIEALEAALRRALGHTAYTEAATPELLKGLLDSVARIVRATLPPTKEADDAA